MPFATLLHTLHASCLLNASGMHAACSAASMHRLAGACRVPGHCRAASMLHAGHEGCAVCMRAQAVILPAATPTADVMNRARAASDMHMMVQHDGKERDADEWRSLLDAAGFRLARIVRTRSIFSVVEAVPK